MAEQFNTISDGTFTLQEGKNKNQFYFYRNDGGVLTNIGREPMEMYQEYITEKMFDGEITDVVANDVYSELSDDGKCIRLTICGIGEKPISKRGNQPCFLKKLFNEIFG